MDHQGKSAAGLPMPNIRALARERRGLFERTRQQHQGIAQGLDVFGLEPAVGCAVPLSMSWLRQIASQLSGQPGDLKTARGATPKLGFISPFISAQETAAHRDARLRQGVTSRSETWSVGTDRLRQAKPLKRGVLSQVPRLTPPTQREPGPSGEPGRGLFLV